MFFYCVCPLPRHFKCSINSTAITYTRNVDASYIFAKKYAMMMIMVEHLNCRRKSPSNKFYSRLIATKEARSFSWQMIFDFVLTTTQIIVCLYGTLAHTHTCDPYIILSMHMHSHTCAACTTHIHINIQYNTVFHRALNMIQRTEKHAVVDRHCASVWMLACQCVGVSELFIY